MEPDIKKLNQLLLSGSCCSQALVSLGLTLKGEENPSLLKASAALCLGVRSGLTCGALTGAAMMMAPYRNWQTGFRKTMVKSMEEVIVIRF